MSQTQLALKEVVDNKEVRKRAHMQVVEKFTAHYVFALGLSRFISCAHWILQLVDGDSFLLQVQPSRRHMPPCASPRNKILLSGSLDSRAHADPAVSPVSTG